MARRPVSNNGHGIQIGQLVAWTKMGKETQTELDGFMICFGNKFPRSCRWMGLGVEWREERNRALEGILQPSGPSAWWVAGPLPEVGRDVQTEGQGWEPSLGHAGLEACRLAGGGSRGSWQSQAI